jgi:hypothetical protein
MNEWISFVPVVPNVGCNAPFGGGITSKLRGKGELEVGPSEGVVRLFTTEEDFRPDNWKTGISSSPSIALRIYKQ